MPTATRSTTKTQAGFKWTMMKGRRASEQVGGWQEEAHLLQGLVVLGLRWRLKGLHRGLCRYDSTWLEKSRQMLSLISSSGMVGPILLPMKPNCQQILIQ